MCTLVLLLPLCVVGLVWLWVTLWRNARAAGASDGPSCGACGYTVTGVSTLACPECGQDLTRVGIVTPRHAKRIGWVGFLVYWSLLLPLPALTAAGIAIAVGPKQGHATYDVELAAVSGGYTVELSDDTATFDGIGRLTGLFGGRPTMHLRFLNAGQYGHLSVDATAMNVVSWSNNVSGQPLTDQAVLHEMGRAGITTTDPAVRREAADLVAFLQQHAGTDWSQPPPPTFTVTHYHAGIYRTPATWWVASCLLAVVVAWLLGCWAYARLRRRIAAAVADPAWPGAG